MAEENAAPAPKPKKKLPLILGLVLGISLVEGAGFFVAFKVFGGGPKPSYGGEDGRHAVEVEKPATGGHGGKSAASEGEGKKGGEGAEASATEVPLLQKFRVPNNQSGKTYIYDFDLTVVVAAGRKEAAEKLVAGHAGEIADRIAQIVRGAEQKALDEYDFKTVRQQIQRALGEIMGDEKLVERVLIPRCVPIRAE